MTRLLAALLLVAVSGVAAAQTVTVTNEAGQTETARTEPATPAAPAAKASAASKDEVAATCLRSTGSRIVTTRNLRAEREGKPQQCTNGAGRVYTREDLDRSGYVDIADALRALDTSIR